MELNDLRKEIDCIDDELVALFSRRMDVSARIAGVKKEKSLPIFVPAREREKLTEVALKAGPELAKLRDQMVQRMIFRFEQIFPKFIYCFPSAGLVDIFEKFTVSGDKFCAGNHRLPPYL